MRDRAQARSKCAGRHFARRDGLSPMSGWQEGAGRSIFGAPAPKMDLRAPFPHPISATDHHGARSGARRSSSALALDRARVSRQPLSQAAIKSDIVDDSNFESTGERNTWAPASLDNPSAAGHCRLRSIRYVVGRRPYPGGLVGPFPPWFLRVIVHGERFTGETAREH